MGQHQGWHGVRVRSTRFEGRKLSAGGGIVAQRDAPRDPALQHEGG